MEKVEACYCVQGFFENYMQNVDETDEGLVVRNKDVSHCESQYSRGAGCGKTARPDLYGGLCKNEVPTITTKRIFF